MPPALTSASSSSSSQFRAIAHDARKDEDNAAFVASLPPAEQAAWLERLRWLRLADRLAEDEERYGNGRFTRFMEAWKALERDGREMEGFEPAHREIRVRLGPEPHAMACWNTYLAALRDYSSPSLALETLADHDRMLARIGSFFGVFPYLRETEREAAARFGMLDQIMNNLRDIAEDAAHGISYFPRDVLARFGVARDAIFDGSAVRAPGYHAMMRFWLDEHVAQVRVWAAPFEAAREVHPSIALMRETSLARYERVERVFGACDFDYLVFPDAYWRVEDGPRSRVGTRA